MRCGGKTHIERGAGGRDVERRGVYEVSGENTHKEGGCMWCEGKRMRGKGKEVMSGRKKHREKKRREREMRR